jgi:hypothetical protein
VIIDTGRLQQESITVLGNRETMVVAFGIILIFYENIEISFDSASLTPLLRIWIRKIRMFLGLLNPDPLIRGTDPDPSFIKQKY